MIIKGILGTVAILARFGSGGYGHRGPDHYRWRFWAILLIVVMCFVVIGVTIPEYGKTPISRKWRIGTCIVCAVLAALLFWFAPILDKANPPHSWTPPR